MFVIRISYLACLCNLITIWWLLSLVEVFSDESFVFSWLSILWSRSFDLICGVQEVVGCTLPLIRRRCIPCEGDVNLSVAILILFREVREVGGTESVFVFDVASYPLLFLTGVRLAWVVLDWELGMVSFLLGVVSLFFVMIRYDTGGCLSCH